MPYEIHDLTNKQLKFGYWFLKHKAKFRAALILALIVFCVITVGYGLYGFIQHFIELPKIDRVLTSIYTNTIDFTNLKQRLAPTKLQISQATVIYTGNNRYDLFAQIYNPNEKYQLDELNFIFQADGFISPTGTISLLPRQQAFLLSLNNVHSSRLAQVTLQLENPKWQRVTEEQTAKTLDFTLSQPVISQTDQGGRNWATFTALNNSLYNLREVQWQGIFYSGTKVVGVNQLTSENFLSGETREITFSWFDKLPRIGKIDIFPVIDLSSAEVFYQLPGQFNPLYGY